jgi:hypothetical protein
MGQAERLSRSATGLSTRDGPSSSGLSGVLIGRLWNRYADQNGLLRLGGIYQRILSAQAGFVDVAQGYWSWETRSSLMQEASAFEE